MTSTFPHSLATTRTARDKIVQWLVSRDTVLMEAALGLNGVVNALLIVTTDDGGKPVAPFLMSSLRWLAFDERSWMCLLSLYALFTLVALVHGQMTGNAYAIRSGVQMTGSIFQAVVAVAIITSPKAPIAGLQYGMTALWSFAVAFILILKHDVRAKAAARGKQGASG